MIPEWLLSAVVTGLISAGGVIVHVQWLHQRIGKVERDVELLLKELLHDRR